MSRRSLPSAPGWQAQPQRPRDRNLTPYVRRLAKELDVDLAEVEPQTGRVRASDVEATAASRSRLPDSSPTQQVIPGVPQDQWSWAELTLTRMAPEAELGMLVAHATVTVWKELGGDGGGLELHRHVDGSVIVGSVEDAASLTRSGLASRLREDRTLLRPDVVVVDLEGTGVVAAAHPEGLGGVQTTVVVGDVEMMVHGVGSADDPRWAQVATRRVVVSCGAGAPDPVALALRLRGRLS